MKKTILACALLATVASAGTAVAGSEEFRNGYWSHSSKKERLRGDQAFDGWRDAWREARRDGWMYRDWRRGRSGSSGTATEEPVDSASDGHTGSDD